jgi:hypothetical protein
LALKSKPVFQSVENRIEMKPLMVVFTGNGAGGAKIHTLRIWINPILGGDPSFADVSTATSVMTADTAGTTISGGNVVGSFIFGASVDAFVLDVTSISANQPPGTLIVFTVEIDGGTSDADVSLLWREYH